jgi:hypothetical protein
MSDTEIGTVMDDAYDDTREGSIRSMVREFYSRRMAWTAAFIWVVALILVGLAVFSAVRFFGATETKSQILYATLFLTFFYWLGLMKVFAWQMVHRNSIAREIKRLEIRLAEMAKSHGQPH